MDYIFLAYFGESFIYLELKYKFISRNFDLNDIHAKDIFSIYVQCFQSYAIQNNVHAHQ